MINNPLSKHHLLFLAYTIFQTETEQTDSLLNNTSVLGILAEVGTHIYSVFQPT